MSLKERTGHSVCPGTILSVLSIFLYCGGFIRVEVQLSGVEQRLKSVEEKLAEAYKQPTSPGKSYKTDWHIQSSLNYTCSAVLFSYCRYHPYVRRFYFRSRLPNYLSGRPFLFACRGMIVRTNKLIPL